MPVRDKSRRLGSRAVRLLAVLATLALVAPIDAAAARPDRTPTPAGPGPALTPQPISLPAPSTSASAGRPRLAGPAPTGACDAAAGRVLVTYRPGAGSAGKGRAAQRIHGKRLHAFELVPGLELVSTSLSVQAATDRLVDDPDVQSVEPDCRRSITTTPNDPGLVDQWGLQNVGADGGTPGSDIHAVAAWTIRHDATSVVVADIDTGMQLNHPDLAANLWTNPREIAGNHIDDDHNGYIDDVHGWDFVNNDASPTDDNGHGTHTAGTIGARGNNGIGVTGVAWSVKLMPLKAFDASGNGYTSAIIAALEYAVDNGASISNNSYSGEIFERSEYNAFAAAGAAGHVAVAAAGNDHVDVDERPHYPASYHLNSIVSVAATTNTDALADFSDFGFRGADLAAPGVGILSTWVGSSYATLSGTSMATPHVTGLAALVKAANPSWTSAQVRDRILGTTRAVPGLSGKLRTGGVVDAAAALGNGPTILPPNPPAPVVTAVTPTLDPDPVPAPATAPTPPAFPSPQALESSSRDLGFSPQIALDSAGRPAIAYSKGGVGIQLLTPSGGTWSGRQLTSAYDDFYWFDLAFDGSDIPQVVVQRNWSNVAAYTDPGVILAGGTQPGPTATRLTASCPHVSTCYWDWEPKIAFDGSGHAHVVFDRAAPIDSDMVRAPDGSAGDALGPGLYYATNATGTWVVRRLTTDAVDGPPSIAVTAAGVVHIVVDRFAGGNSGLYHFTNAGGTWTSLRLTDYVEDLWTSAGVDSTGALHVTYARSGYGLYVRTRSAAGTWTAPAIVYDAPASAPDLAIGPGNHVHIVFGTATESDEASGVRYLTDASGSWTGAAVAGGQGHDPSIAVDAAGHAHVAYQQATGPTVGILYATNASGSFVSTLAAAPSSEGGVGALATATDASGHHHVALPSRIGESTAGLWYGTDASGSWSFSRVTAHVPSAVSLAVDPGGIVHLAYNDTTSDQVTYATNAGGSWAIRAVEGVGGTINAVAIALDPTGSPVILFPDASGLHLRRARLVGGVWAVDTIYTSSGQINLPSALIAPSGELDVSLSTWVSGDVGPRIVFIRGTTGAWSATSVTSGAKTHVTSSIARATDGTIWLAEWTSDDIVTVHRRSPGGAWTHDLLPGASGEFPTVAVASSGRVHLAYSLTGGYTAANCAVPECPAGPGVRDAVYDGSTWTTTKLTGQGRDFLPTLGAGRDGSVTLTWLRAPSGLRALTLVAGVPAPTIRLQAASDTGTSSVDGLTRASALAFDVSFDRSVGVVQASDFQVTGTATSCVVQPPSGAGARYVVSLTGCSAGTVILSMRPGAVSDGVTTGPLVATPSRIVTIDRTPPTVGVPTVTFRTGIALAGSAMPVRLSWSLGDTGGSGLVPSTVSRSLDGGLTWSTLSSAVAGTTFDTTVPSSGTVRFRIGAADRAGNVRLGSATPTLTPRLVQQSATAISYAGSWTTSTSTSYSGGSARVSSKAGASATYRFTGRAVAIVATRSTARGQFRVYVDGVYAGTVDCRGTTQYRSIVWQRRWTASGTHALKLVVVGTSGRPRIDLDAFEVIR